jgi:hypothetical protein
LIVHRISAFTNLSTEGLSPNSNEQTTATGYRSILSNELPPKTDPKKQRPPTGRKKRIPSEAIYMAGKRTPPTGVFHTHLSADHERVPVAVEKR